MPDVLPCPTHGPRCVCLLQDRSPCTGQLRGYYVDDGRLVHVCTGHYPLWCPADAIPGTANDHEGTPHA